MTISIEEIDNQWRNEAEFENLEFKEAKENFDRETLAEICVAIANAKGGHLFLGLTDRVPRKIVGTNAFKNIIKLREYLFQEIKFTVQIEEILHPDGRVLVFVIPSRPVGVAYEFKNRFPTRVGSQTTTMNPNLIREILNEALPHWLEEPIIKDCDGQTIVELLDTQKFFSLLKSPYPSSQDEVIHKLIELKLIEGSNNHFVIKRIAPIVLAKDLGKFDLEAKSVRVLKYKDNTKLSTVLDKIIPRGFAVCFEELNDLVMEHLPRNEVRSPIRDDGTLLPRESIRELLANALIHQDFIASGNRVTIEIYSDRVEISNPGIPIIDINRFIDGSNSRNERLAELMRRFGICEIRGSGVDRVISLTEGNHLPAPQFNADAALHSTKVTIFGNIKFENLNLQDRIRACYQHCVLKYVQNEKMTNESLRTRFKLENNKQTLVSQIINATISASLIKKDEKYGESKKYARYIPNWS